MCVCVCVCARAHAGVCVCVCVIYSNCVRARVFCSTPTSDVETPPVSCQIAFKMARLKVGFSPVHDVFSPDFSLGPEIDAGQCVFFSFSQSGCLGGF